MTIRPEDGVFPHGQEPVLHDVRIVGRTTSGTFGYRIGTPVASVFVERAAGEAARR